MNYDVNCENFLLQNVSCTRYWCLVNIYYICFPCHIFNVEQILTQVFKFYICNINVEAFMENEVDRYER